MFSMYVVDAQGVTRDPGSLTIGQVGFTASKRAGAGLRTLSPDGRGGRIVQPELDIR